MGNCDVIRLRQAGATFKTLVQVQVFRFLCNISKLFAVGNLHTCGSRCLRIAESKLRSQKEFLDLTL
jgi:hypothetical protein